MITNLFGLPFFKVIEQHSRISSDIRVPTYLFCVAVRLVARYVFAGSSEEVEIRVCTNIEVYKWISRYSFEYE